MSRYFIYIYISCNYLNVCIILLGNQLLHPT